MNIETIKELVKSFNTDDTIALTQQLIQIQSIDPPGNEADMSQFVKNYLESANVDSVETISVDGLDPNRMNVIAKIPGSGQAAPLIFSGHMDVVPVSERELAQWECDPFIGIIRDDGFL